MQYVRGNINLSCRQVYEADGGAKYRNRCGTEHKPKAEYSQRQERFVNSKRIAVSQANYQRKSCESVAGLFLFHIKNLQQRANARL